MSEAPALVRLAAYRLENDLTYIQLSDEMARAGYPVKARSLHFAITNRLKHGPLERTAYKIEQFVTQVVDRDRGGRKTAKKNRRQPEGIPT
jgi:hypothetical protein